MLSHFNIHNLLHNKHFFSKGRTTADASGTLVKTFLWLGTFHRMRLECFMIYLRLLTICIMNIAQEITPLWYWIQSTRSSDFLLIQ